MTRWGFIGSGKMATALIKGMIRAGIATAESIFASDPLPAARTRLAVRHRYRRLRFEPRRGRAERRAGPGRQAAEHERRCSHELRPAVTAEHLVVSVAAGITIASIDEGLGATRPARAGDAQHAGPGRRGGVGVCDGAADASPRTRPSSKGCLESVGRAVRVPESLLDAVTGLSGSGPAFVYLMIEALSDGGVRVGLAARRGHAAGGPDRARRRDDGARDRRCIPACSRTRWPRRAARRSPGCTRWSAAASAGP